MEKKNRQKGKKETPRAYISQRKPALLTQVNATYNGKEVIYEPLGQLQPESTAKHQI